MSAATNKNWLEYQPLDEGEFEKKNPILHTQFLLVASKISDIAKSVEASPELRLELAKVNHNLERNTEILQDLRNCVLIAAVFIAIVLWMLR